MSKLALPISSEEFIRTYYYRNELAGFCRQNKLDSNGQKVKLEKRILSFLKGEKIIVKIKLPKTKWLQDKLGLDSEVTSNYKNNKVTRDFFESVIGASFKFNGAMMNYKKLYPNFFVTYQDLVDAYYADKIDQKVGIMTSQRYYKGNRYNKFVREYFAKNENIGKTRNNMIVAWNELKQSGKVNKL